jgi:hypothetical protein
MKSLLRLEGIIIQSLRSYVVKYGTLFLPLIELCFSLFSDLQTADRYPVRITLHSICNIYLIVTTKSKPIYLSISMDTSPSLEANNYTASQDILDRLWNNESSLPCSQEPATGPYPDRDGSTHIYLQNKN